MTYTTEDIARVLRRARETKGLSQRELSAKAGLTQTSISRIENATVDLQLSNLLELARALDLEVMLVPRKAVTATQGLIRTIEPKPPARAESDKATRHFDNVVRKLANLDLGSAEIKRLRELVTVFRSLRFNEEQVRTLQDAVKELQQIGRRAAKTGHAKTSNSAVDARRFVQITRDLQDLRNAIVHVPASSDISRIVPAYRLDEGDSNG